MIHLLIHRLRNGFLLSIVDRYTSMHVYDAMAQGTFIKYVRYVSVLSSVLRTNVAEYDDETVLSYDIITIRIYIYTYISYIFRSKYVRADRIFFVTKNNN